MEWNRETILHLLNLITERHVIWDPNLAANKRQRTEAIEEIGVILGVTPMEVNTKWTTLKNQYNREKRKVTENKGTDSPYNTKWYAYKEMDALMGRGGRIKRKISNFWMQDRHSEEEDSCSSPPQGSHTSFSTSQNDCRSSNNTQTTSRCETIETNNDRTDELTNYGLYLAGHIRKYPPPLQSRAKYEINKILYQLDLEQFGMYSGTVMSVEDNNIVVEVKESKVDPLEKE